MQPPCPHLACVEGGNPAPQPPLPPPSSPRKFPWPCAFSVRPVPAGAPEGPSAFRAGGRGSPRPGHSRTLGGWAGRTAFRGRPGLSAVAVAGGTAKGRWVCSSRCLTPDTCTVRWGDRVRFLQGGAQTGSPGHPAGQQPPDAAQGRADQIPTLARWPSPPRLRAEGRERVQNGCCSCYCWGHAAEGRLVPWSVLRCHDHPPQGRTGRWLERGAAPGGQRGQGMAVPGAGQ